jgi:hypothetical protein
MFSFKYAFFCIAAGLLAGRSFDKKKSGDMVWVGIFTYLIIFSVFYVNFPYDHSWAFVALIEVLAGHGLYKMGFGNFLSETFSNRELKQKVDKVITASKVAKATYNERSSTSQDDESRRESTMQKLGGDFLGFILAFALFMVALYIIAWIADLIGII